MSHDLYVPDLSFEKYNFRAFAVFESVLMFCGEFLFFCWFFCWFSGVLTGGKIFLEKTLFMWQDLYEVNRN